MKLSTKLIGAAGFVVAVLVVGFFALPAFLGLESDSPPELAIGDRADDSITAVLERGQEPALAADEDVEQVDVATSIQIETIDGTWTIVGDSVAGYRVFKDFVGASEFEAVGRTSSVFGDLTIDGTSVTDAEFNVNIASIVSDDERRDAQFRGPILNTNIFPLANFTLTSPIDLGSTPTNGDEVNVVVTGELTLKGVAQEVEFPLTARLVGDQVQVAGSIDVVFEDFGITPPSTPVIVVRDEGVIEFSLFFEMTDVA